MTFNNFTFDVASIFAKAAKEILSARDTSSFVHGGSKDIRAAGNEVEIAVREYLNRTLPTKFNVTHGHLIDHNGIVSSQLDIIVSDNTSLPSLMRLKDGTDYVPYDSVYLFGEVKSTYRDSSKPIQEFSSKIQSIRGELSREEIKNTAFDGQVEDETLLFDMIYSSPNRILNHLLTFMVFVDSGDFDYQKIQDFFKSTADENLPNIIILLDAGILFAGEINEQGFSFNKYPSYHPERGKNWYFSKIHSESHDSSSEGNHLAFLYYYLIQHLAHTRIENSFQAKYFEKALKFRKSTTNLIK